MDLRELIVTIALKYDPKLGFGSEAQRLLRRATHELTPWIPPGYIVHGSGGQGTTAFVPWIAVFDPDETVSAQRGMYVVYLFAVDFRTVVLSLNHGVTDLVKELGTKIAHDRLATQAEAIRSALPFEDLKGLETTIALPDTAARPRHYMKGNVVAKTYRLDALPSNDAMATDLRRFIRIYGIARDVREHLRKTKPGAIATYVSGTGEVKPPMFVPEFKPKNDADYRQQVVGQWLLKTRKHETLVDKYGQFLGSRGFKPATNVHPRDLLAFREGKVWLIEAKMIRHGDGMGAAREALGQLLAYRYLHHRGEHPRMVALFSESVGLHARGLLESYDIAAVWADGDLWRGSSSAYADGLCDAIDSDVGAAPR